MQGAGCRVQCAGCRVHGGGAPVDPVAPAGQQPRPLLVEHPAKLRFRGGLVFEAHRLMYHWRVIKKKKQVRPVAPPREQPRLLRVEHPAELRFRGGLVSKAHILVHHS